MRLQLLDNGINSLQKGFFAFEEFENRTVSSSPTLEDYYYLKEAILYTHHGIEILLKYMLTKTSEFLIISNIDSKYLEAYQEKNKNHLSSIFETNKADDVHTVTYKEALDRIVKIIGAPISKSFEDRLTKLNKIRNAITHAEIHISDNEVISIFPDLLDDIDHFFFKHLGEEYKSISGYSELRNNYDRYMKVLANRGDTIKKEAVSAFTKASDACGFAIGQRTVKRVTDKTKIKQFIRELKNHIITFYMNFYYGLSSENANMRILDEDHISIECVDINIDFIFKLKSMIIVMPDSLSRSTPFLLFESEDDQSPKEKLPAHPNPLNYNDDYVEGYLFSDGNEGFDANEVYNSLMRIAYDPDSQNEADYRVKQYFMKRKIIAAISIPSLIRPDFLNFLNNNQDKDGHVVEIELKTGYRNKKVVP